MGSLAGLLLEAGHEVTGTDLKLYPPMSDMLAQIGVEPFEGYSAGNILRAKPELIVVGNVIRRDNPEAQEALRSGIPYKSMPQALSDLFLEKRTPMVISGTHGKTTASTLAAWLLDFAGEEPGFLIGGVGQNFKRGFRTGSGPFFVVEGDEYDTAFFDKGPKFLHYRPQACIITSIEFDHADIYGDLESIRKSFRLLAGIMPPDGLLVANADDPEVMKVAKLARCRVATYGIEGGEWRPERVGASESGTSFFLDRAGAEFRLPMWGEHNLSNAVGIIAMLVESGIDPSRISAGLPLFEGVKRRQELVADIKGVAVIDDFAHHPTAVAKTIASMRERFPDRRVWAIFEPRSNTARRNFFQKDFASALSTADRVVVAGPYRAEAIAKGERFDSAEVADSIMRSGVDAHYIPDTGNIVEFVIRGVSAGDVVLVMSNGGFDDLIERLIGALKKRRIYASDDEVSPSRVPK